MLLHTNTEGDYVSLQMQASGGDGMLSYSASGLPAGLSINSSTGLINGSVAYGDAQTQSGLYSVTITADDAYGDSGNTTFNWTIYAAPPIAVNDSYTVDPNATFSVNASGVLANDSDPDKLKLSAALASNPSDGSLKFYGDGSFTYTPNAHYTGTDSFTYYAVAGGQESNPATVTLNVQDSGTITTQPGSYSVLHGQVLTVDADNGVLANDSDSDGDSLTVSPWLGPNDGSLQLNGDGSFTYTPNAGFVGTDSFTYTASDGIKTSSPTTVTIDVTDHAPTTSNLSYTLPEDSTLNVSVSGGLLSSASDADGDPLTVSVTSYPNYGMLSVNSDGSFTYATSDYSGSDSFQYTVSDGALTATGTVTLTINSTNTAPTAGAASYSVVHDTTLNVPASGLLADASDSDGDFLTVSAASQPSHGSVTVNSDGSFTYTPDALYVGSDSFTYTASDGSLTSAPATVSISVTNQVPVASNDSYSVERNNEFDTDTSTGVLANDSDGDGDDLTASLVSGPTNGTLTLNPDGSFDYTPNTNFTGTDTFTYQASDGVSTSNTATVTLTVTATPPSAANQSLDVLENNTLNAPSATLMLGDSNPDNMTLTAQDVTQPANGTVTVNSDGSFVYTPNNNFTGTDSFTYDLTDGTLTSSAATVTIDVSSNNTPPSAGNLSYSVDENSSLSTDSDSGVLSAASDSDGDTLLATLYSGPSNGTLSLSGDGSFTYTPNTNFYGTDSFQYEAYDGTYYSGPATVTITVDEDLPTAVNDSYSVLPSGPTSVSATNGVLSNDSDSEGTPLTAVLETSPADGSVTLNSDGSFTYTPNSSFTGSDSFTYEAYNGVNYSSPATVTLTSGPVASDQSYSVMHDQTLSVNEIDEGLLTGAYDADGDSLTASLATGPSDGMVSVNSDGLFTYVPYTHYVGTDSFTFTVSNGMNVSTPATATIDVTNDVPTSNDQTWDTSENTALTVSAVNGVLTSSSDDDGDSLTAQLVSGPSDGTIELGSAGNFTYTPNTGFYGTDSFTYDVSDGVSTSAAATVTITVNPVLTQGNNDFRAVATGDFNGDGNPDFVAADYGNNAVDVFLGNGDGTFQTPTVYNVGQGPLAVAVGNFGNGTVDIAVANSLDNTVTILMNNGSGSFTSSQVINVGTDPVSIAVGDFVGDGVLDLAVANEGSNTVSILQNNGSGTFSVVNTISVGRTPDSVAAGDLNGDGKDDLVVANFGDDNVSVLLSDGGDTFAAPVNYTVGTGPTSVALGDLDGDGNLDVAVVNGGSNNVSVLMGKGNGPLTSPTNYAVGSDPVSIAVADFAADGVADIAVVNHGSNDDTILYTTDDGVAQYVQTNPLGESPYAVAVADFNRDGLPDQIIDGKPEVVCTRFNPKKNLPPVTFTNGHSIALITGRTIAGDYVKGISSSNTVKDTTGSQALIREVGKYMTGYFHAIVISGHGDGLGVKASAGTIGWPITSDVDWKFIGTKLAKDGVLVFASCDAAGERPYDAMKALAKLIGHPVIANTGSVIAGGGGTGYWVTAYPNGAITTSNTE